MSPTFSFCTTNYNCAHALREHLDSVFGQLAPGSFEYIVVDNYSTDGSYDELGTYASSHPNMQVLQRRCTMGRGRQIAFERSRGPYIVVVDTDTVYGPLLRQLLERYLASHHDVALQAIYCGIFPRALWEQVGGRGNFNQGEDLDMWIRLWRLGKMRWSLVETGRNVKEPETAAKGDFLSRRYGRTERFLRRLRQEFDNLRMERYYRMDLNAIVREHAVDLGLGPLRTTWVGHGGSGFLRRAKVLAWDTRVLLRQ